MKSLVLNFIPQIRKSIDILELKTILSLRKWRLYTEDKNLSIYYFFKADGGLIESTNGLVKKASWEYLGNRSILIEGKDNLMLLVNYITHNDKAILLQTEGTSNYIILLNTDYAHLHDLEYEEFMKSLAFFLKRKKKLIKAKIQKLRLQRFSLLNMKLYRKIIWKTILGALILVLKLS